MKSRIIVYSELAEKVCVIAKQAGEFIRQERLRFRQEEVERKHAHDYVSYVDKQSEQFIVTSLRKLLPEAGFITEEGLAGYSNEQYCWVVDPLDGTTNFVHNYAPYAVSIALIKGNEILLGIVYEVCADECFFSWKDGGSWLIKGDLIPASEDGSPIDLCSHAQRLQVSSQPLSDALVCFQLPYNSGAYNPIIRRLIASMYGRVASIRMIGSAAMALCYVAAGRLDAYAEKYIGRWDYMAGALLVQEAGGQVTTYDGMASFMQGDNVVATNGFIHRSIVDAVQMALRYVEEVATV